MNKPKGTKDLFGEEIDIYNNLINYIQKKCNEFNYYKIETPIFESLELFKRIGEDTDVVNKEMYIFEDKSNRKMALRPEGTASIARAIIENKFINLDSDLPLRLYYIGDMFRYERPQSGRFRQFKQFGVELYSQKNPYYDFEVIQLIDSIFKGLNLDNYIFKINSIGSFETRKTYISKIRPLLEKNASKLSEVSKKNIERNILRILDSKDKNDIRIVATLPKIYDYLTIEERKYFDTLVKLFKQFKIKYEIDDTLVRGLDYYNDFVFEVSESVNDKSILGGGRYDNLLKSLGGNDYSAIGFALGLERLIDLYSKSNSNKLLIEKKDIVYIGTLDEKSFEFAYNNISRSGLNIYLEYNFNKKLKYHFSKSDKLNSNYTIILGNKDLEKKEFTIKNNLTKKITNHPIENFLKLNIFK